MEGKDSVCQTAIAKPSHQRQSVTRLRAITRSLMDSLPSSVMTTILWRLPQTTRAVVDQPSVPSSPSSAAWIGTLASGEPPEVRSPDGPPVQVTV